MERMNRADEGFQVPRRASAVGDRTVVFGADPNPFKNRPALGRVVSLLIDDAIPGWGAGELLIRIDGAVAPYFTLADAVLDPEIVSEIEYVSPDDVDRKRLQEATAPEGAVVLAGPAIGAEVLISSGDRALLQGTVVGVLPAGLVLDLDAPLYVVQIDTHVDSYLMLRPASGLFDPAHAPPVSKPSRWASLWPWGAKKSATS